MKRQEENVQNENIQEAVVDFREGRTDRRDFLRKVVGLGLSSAAAYALLDTATAEAQTVTTFAVGEEADSPYSAERVTTQSVGEESSSGSPTTYAVGEENVATTQAIGEESNTPPASTRAVGEESTPSTRAFGEEGQSNNPTTMALGEEGRPSTPVTRAIGEGSGNSGPGIPSTRAAGEEGNSGQVTTYAIGEEQPYWRSPSRNSNSMPIPRAWESFRRW